MALTLYSHPLSSFCQKVLIALYENDTPFTPRLVDFGNAQSVAALKQLWPVRKMPVLHDDARNQVVPESSIIIEYLDRHYPGRNRLLPDDTPRGLRVRELDRFYDLYVHLPMQKIVGDRLRPAERKDQFGVEEARGQLKTALDFLEAQADEGLWATGDAFTLADCAAAPALYYANLVMPFAQSHKRVADYFNRLLARPSFARAVEEAEPYRHMFPQ